MPLSGPSRTTLARAVARDLRQLSRQMAAHERLCAAAADLSAAQAGALVELEEAGPLAMNDLAERLGIARSTATRLVDQLEKHAWIRRGHDPDDRRRVVLELLPEGIRRAQRVQEEAYGSAWELVRAAGVDPALLERLRLLGRALQERRARETETAIASPAVRPRP